MVAIPRTIPSKAGKEIYATLHEPTCTSTLRAKWFPPVQLQPGPGGVSIVDAQDGLEFGANTRTFPTGNQLYTQILTRTRCGLGGEHLPVLMPGWLRERPGSLTGRRGLLTSSGPVFVGLLTQTPLQSGVLFPNRTSCRLVFFFVLYRGTSDVSDEVAGRTHKCPPRLRYS